MLFGQYLNWNDFGSPSIGVTILALIFGVMKVFFHIKAILHFANNASLCLFYIFQIAYFMIVSVNVEDVDLAYA